MMMPDFRFRLKLSLRTFGQETSPTFSRGFVCAGLGRMEDIFIFPVGLWHVTWSAVYLTEALD